MKTKSLGLLLVLYLTLGFPLLAAIAATLYQNVTVEAAEACDNLNTVFVRESIVSAVQDGAKLVKNVYGEIDTISNAAFESELNIDYSYTTLTEIEDSKLATNFGPMLNTETAPVNAVYEDDAHMVGYIDVSYESVHYFYPLWVFDKEMQRMDIYSYSNEEDVNAWLQCLASNYPEFVYERQTAVEAGTVWNKGITTFADGETNIIEAVSKADGWYFQDAIYNTGM